MNRNIALILLTSGMLISLSACKMQPKYYNQNETFRKYSTESTKATKSIIYENTYENAVLTSESGETVKFRYDSDLITYIGQGGTFYPVGGDVTKNFLHITLQDVSVSSFDEVKSASSKYEIKELKLESGRKAFCYSPASDSENLYIIIDAKDVIPSGKGVINCYIGAKASWTYTEEKLANIIDKGFSAPK